MAKTKAKKKPAGGPRVAYPGYTVARILEAKRELSRLRTLRGLLKTVERLHARLHADAIVTARCLLEDTDFCVVSRVEARRLTGDGRPALSTPTKIGGKPVLPIEVDA